METRQPEVVIDSARIGCLFQGFVDPYKLHITIMFVSDVFVNVMPAECHFCKQKNAQNCSLKSWRICPAALK